MCRDRKQHIRLENSAKRTKMKQNRIKGSKKEQTRNSVPRGWNVQENCREERRSEGGKLMEQIWGRERMTAQKTVTALLNTLWLWAAPPALAGAHSRWWERSQRLVEQIASRCFMTPWVGPRTSVMSNQLLSNNCSHSTLPPVTHSFHPLLLIYTFCCLTSHPAAGFTAALPLVYASAWHFVLLKDWF